MAGIERCEARVRHIRNVNSLSHLGTHTEEVVASTPDAHYHIGKSQNSPENIVTFLRDHFGDPAIKVGQLSLW